MSIQIRSTTKFFLVPNTVSDAAKSDANVNSHEIFRYNIQTNAERY